MQNLYKDLEKILLSNDNFKSEDGKVLKNKVTESAVSNDKALITTLLKNAKLKKHFFDEIEKGVVAFDREKFIRFINTKEFLPNSFTSFTNKIGLHSGKEYLNASDKVSLVWAYKDCVLEGGQDKEDQKRSEIFYNETLAPDEIDRLFEKKVLTDFKKYSKKGEEVPKEITESDNLIIKGNNLLALHSLRKKYAGKVKLVYIDPPYNTGNDSFNYNDRFNHSTWLTFMRNRLEIARELLSNDGFIFVQTDNNEQGYLRVLMDEIFGRDNFINSIIWKRTFSHGDVGQGAKHLGRLHDVILFYGKTRNFKLNTVYTPYSVDYIKNFYKYEDEGGIYRLVSLLGPGGAAKGNPYYEFLGVKKYWVYSKDKMQKLYAEGKIVQTKKGSVPQKKRYLNEAPGVPLQDLWLDINPLQGSSKEKTTLTGQKPEELMKRMIELTTNTGDIVLDFHMGSGSTCVASHKLGRQYIGVEQMELQLKMAIPRLIGTIDGESSGITKSVKWKGGGSFIYCELKEWNQGYVDEIESATTNKKLHSIYEKMKKEAFFRYEVDLSKFDVKEFSKLELADQKRVLLDCLDKNHLYVNYSDINDTTYKVSPEEKKLNKLFYGE